MPTPTVAHVVREYLPRSQTFVYSQLRFLRQFRPVVLAGIVSGLDEFPFEPVVELAPVTSAPGRATRRLRSRVAGFSTTFAARAASEIAAHDAALVHAHFGPTGHRVLAAAQARGVPLVTTFYGYDLALPDSHPEFVERYERLFAGGELFLTEGPAMARTLEDIGCPPERIRTLRIGFDVEAFPFSPRDRSNGPLTFVQTGRMVEKKGFDLSIRAFAAARQELAGAQLLLIGDGPLRADLEALAARLGVASTVRFLGSLSYGEYAAAMRAGHIGLQPSRVASNGDTEGGAPTVLLEMQASGMPLAGTRHADIPFVVADRGDLVEEEDAEGLAAAMVRLAGLPEDEWVARAERGRAFVEEHHTGERVAAALSDHYREALGERPAAPTNEAALAAR